MTVSLRKAFIDTVDSENDMWNAIRAFINTDVDVRRFPRIFRLDNDKLVLTRKCVSKTVTLHRVNPGYSYNKSVWWNSEEKAFNRELYSEFVERHKPDGEPIQFGTNAHQTHYVIRMKYSTFFEEFLKHYRYPKETSFGVPGFETILESIQVGTMEDEVYVLVMRYKDKQFRSLSPSKYSIKELPQGYDSGTNHDGDKSLTGYMNKFHFQIHLVYVEKDKSNEYMPMIAMNNPITEFSARYVTGDNSYETV